MKFGAVCSLAEIQRIIVYLPAIRISIGLTLAAFISTRTPSGLSTVGFGNDVNFAHLQIHVHVNNINIQYNHEHKIGLSDGCSCYETENGIAALKRVQRGHETLI